MNLNGLIKILKVNNVPFEISALPKGWHRVHLSWKHVNLLDELNWYEFQDGVAVDLTF